MSDKQYISDLEKANDRLTKEKDELMKEVTTLTEKISILSNRLSKVEQQVYMNHDERLKELKRLKELEKPTWRTVTTINTGPFLPNNMELP
jgi:predicted  nucleic acid-binding Zn-ribbon protein